MSLPSQPDVPPPRPPKPAHMRGIPGPPPKGPAPHPPPSRPPPVPPQLAATVNAKSQKHVPSQPPPLIPAKQQPQQPQQQPNALPKRPQNPPPKIGSPPSRQPPGLLPPSPSTAHKSLPSPAVSSAPTESSLKLTEDPPIALSPTTTTSSLSLPPQPTVPAPAPSLSPLSATSTSASASPQTTALGGPTSGEPTSIPRPSSGYEARKARRARRRQAVCLTQEDLDNLFKTQEGEAEMSYMEVAAALAEEEKEESNSIAPSSTSPGSSSSSGVTVPMGGSSNVVLPSATSSSTSSASDASKGKGHKEKGPAYDELLEMAKMENFGDLDRQEFLFTSGYDSKGRTILVLIGSKLPSRKVPLDKLFLYFLRTLDPVVEREYVLVYFAKGQSSENRPPFSWLRRAYSLFNRKYKKNLKGLYVVQPTTWLKMVLRLFKPFVSKKFWAKVNLINTFEGIYEHISPSQLRLPGSYVEEAASMRPLFGESLDVVVKNPTQQSGGVPIIVNDCISYLYEKGLDAEGLLRISGNRSIMNEYRLAYDSGKPVNINECNDPHTVANLLKLYLRELPEPIFTYDLYRPLIRVQMAQMPEDQKVAALAKVLEKLPQANRLVLWHLVSFAAELANHTDKTKMTPDNIALCLAPTLMWCRPEELTPTTAITEMGIVNSIFKTILLNKNCLIDSN